MAFSDIMPIAASLGFTQEQAVSAFNANKDALRIASTQTYNQNQYKDIFDLIIEYTTVKNCGGYLTIAKRVGCSYQDAVAITDEILNGFKEADRLGLIED